MEIVSKLWKIAGIVMLLLLAANAWSESKRPMYLAHPTSVGGKMLAAGNYVLRWEGAGEQAQVRIYQGKNEVASLPARVIQLSSPAGFNSAVVENVGGTSSLSEIRFEGKKFALRVVETAGGASAAK